ncbi:hypothetical protein DPMN_066861 [Dreissena polymorpha]|uniref:Uncharacterized protein n=1 Tax=Dreissena polymorpha TaxID=45954 RepID=A0A9D3YYQ0_DREPO|nr:hypothetical protein DPMN_066861 [Dreissena polymorpha]
MRVDGREVSAGGILLQDSRNPGVSEIVVQYQERRVDIGKKDKEWNILTDRREPHFSERLGKRLDTHVGSKALDSTSAIQGSAGDKLERGRAQSDDDLQSAGLTPGVPDW